MGSQDQSLPKAHGNSLPEEVIGLKPTPELRLPRISFGRLTQPKKTTWGETGLLCVSPLADQEFKNADIPLLAFQYSCFCALLPGMVKAAAEPGSWSREPELRP